MRLGFIGCGNMGGAMVSGILKNQLLFKEELIASALHEASRNALREKFGITVTDNNLEVAAVSDVLVLAVKPQFYAEVIHEVREQIRPNTLVVSIAPGKTSFLLTFMKSILLNTIILSIVYFIDGFQ